MVDGQGLFLDKRNKLKDSLNRQWKVVDSQSVFRRANPKNELHLFHISTLTTLLLSLRINLAN